VREPRVGCGASDGFIPPLKEVFPTAMAVFGAATKRDSITIHVVTDRVSQDRENEPSGRSSAIAIAAMAKNAEGTRLRLSRTR
jgi:hypothetical protein